MFICDAVDAVNDSGHSIFPCMRNSIIIDMLLNSSSNAYLLIIFHRSI